MPIDRTSIARMLPYAFDALPEQPGITLISGKVRDSIDRGDRRILIATDRHSAFDVAWCTIPCKGQILNQLSAWWFDQVRDLVPTHLLSVPDPNVMVVNKLSMFPIEIVVRGYLTGSTTTSIWHHYAEGGRYFSGHTLPDGLRKNDPLPHPLVTPTTKGEHDEPLDAATIVQRALATQEQWEHMEAMALALFARGQQIAAQRGYILADTKYEMGLDAHGVITLGDEVHTPDSSRYFDAHTYAERMQRSEEPMSVDKEYFRLWLKSQGFPKTRPVVTDDIRIDVAARYIALYEGLTGQAFLMPDEGPIGERITRVLGSLP